MKAHAALLLSLVVFRVHPAEAQQPGRPELPVRRAAEPPKIDGVLDDRAWVDSMLPLGEWRSYNPVRGDKSPFQTEVHVTYDDRNLYFAFHCIDPEPEKIRTTISRRDNVFSDDWVGLSLDSAGSAQSSYHLMINPDGIQMDAINTPANGEQFEADFVWESAGKVTADGYIVEVALPLQSIRFKGGAGVRMGVLFWRHISRTGVSYSSPDLPPGLWVFDRHAHLAFDALKQPRLIELLPSVTAPVNQTRATDEGWNPATARGHVGLSAKYGITSSVTLDATINPDFSQVESDAFQVTVNQRFPVYFSEKRPFFMEGMGLFNIAGTGGDSNMRTAVHTRRIIDPSWGAKVTGTEGKLTFGLLNSSDDHPETIGDGGGAVDNRNTIFTIARATYSIGGPSYLGVIVTDTEHPDRHNLVVGSDVAVRLTPSQQMSATVLTSRTRVDAGPAEQDTHGSASQVTYNYNTRLINSASQLEHYDRDFQMDTAFYNRTGFTAGWSYLDLSFYPAAGNRFGVQRVFPFFQGKAGRDQVQQGNERSVILGLGMSLTRQSYMKVSVRRGKEPWAGQVFDSGDAHAEGDTQLFPWLKVFAAYSRGPATYYDPVNPFQGRSTSTRIGVTLQPDAHFNQEVTYDGVLFDREDDSRVFTAHILYTRTTYQFNRHFLVRDIEQFDSSTHRLLTDLLASYELIPGSVFHAGYGSSFDKVGYRDGASIPNTGRYLTTSRGLFFKVSYLFRL